MPLNISVFVPEGIIVSSDTLAFVKNGDEGYFSTAVRTFCLWDRYILSFAGEGYIDGMPYGYYISLFLKKNDSDRCQTVNDFAKLFIDFMGKYSSLDKVIIYCAGYDISDTDFVPCLMLIDKGDIIRLNYDSDNSQVLYNYHVVGNSLWINKLFLSTTFVDNVICQKETFNAANIDFSKYSVKTAVDFSKFLFDLTGKMDLITQTRPSVNNEITVAVVTPLGKTNIYKI